MLFKIEDAMALPQFQNMNPDEIKRKLDALEVLIRKYTNNNFQNRDIRFAASSSGRVLNGCHPFIEIGDTLQISESKVNDGLYVIEDIDTENETVTVDKDLYMVAHNLVTKIVYPVDVLSGALRLLQWEIENAGRVGVKSETLSRHSITYFDMDKNNQVMGYPVSLLGFLEMYKKARF